jgi:hypothetical protein
VILGSKQAVANGQPYPPPRASGKPERQAEKIELAISFQTDTFNFNIDV